MQSTVQSVLEHERNRLGTHGKGLEVPYQNTFKDKPCLHQREAHEGVCS